MTTITSNDKQPLQIHELSNVQLEFLRTAKEYAYKCHADTNHLYDGKPYANHLVMVVNYGLKYAYILKDRDAIHYVLASCYTHDTIEDTRQTYNDVKMVCGDIVADITYALTNEKGKNRKERAGAKYYQGIRATPCASFVKICDRLANVRYSLDNNGSMLDKYRKEQEGFKRELYAERFKDMFDELDAMLAKK